MSEASGVTVSPLAYSSAIDLLEASDSEHVVGGLTIFTSSSACGRPTIVVINQLDTEECVQIKL